MCAPSTDRGGATYTWLRKMNNVNDHWKALDSRNDKQWLSFIRTYNLHCRPYVRHLAESDTIAARDDNDDDNAHCIVQDDIAADLAEETADYVFTGTFFQMLLVIAVHHSCTQQTTPTSYPSIILHMCRRLPPTLFRQIGPSVPLSSNSYRPKV